MVALNGDPTQAGAAFSGVMMASIARGGSADDIAPGVAFFKELNDAGNFLPVDPTPATIESGQTLPARLPGETPPRGAWGGPGDRQGGGLLLPAHQRGRPAPRGRPPLAGV